MTSYEQGEIQTRYQVVRQDHNQSTFMAVNNQAYGLWMDSIQSIQVDADRESEAGQVVNRKCIFAVSVSKEPKVLNGRNQ